MAMDGFEAYYKSFYSIGRNVSVETSELAPKRAVCHDKKACQECVSAGVRECDVEANLIVRHGVPVKAVNIEAFFSQFGDTMKASLKDRCDLMLYDDVQHKIAFCDMTCSMEKYIQPFDNTSGHHEGKRAKAYQQMKESINKLAAVPELNSAMSSYSYRRAVFAVRLKAGKSRDAVVQSNMQAFSSAPWSVSNAKTDMGNGFFFETVTYPQEYIW